jgi:hypothetical protein
VSKYKHECKPLAFAGNPAMPARCSYAVVSLCSRELID